MKESIWENLAEKTTPVPITECAKTTFALGDLVMKTPEEVARKHPSVKTENAIFVSWHIFQSVFCKIAIFVPTTEKSATTNKCRKGSKFIRWIPLQSWFEHY